MAKVFLYHYGDVVALNLAAMKSPRQIAAKFAGEGREGSFPDEASLAALRAWYDGLPAREAVTWYLGNRACRAD